MTKPSYMITEYRRYKIMKMLMYHQHDPSVYNNLAIQFASSYNNINIFKMLLNDCRVNPFDKNNRALKIASTKGFIDICELLTNNLDVLCSNNIYQIIKIAKKFGHQNIVSHIELELCKLFATIS